MEGSTGEYQTAAGDVGDATGDSGLIGELVKISRPKPDSVRCYQG